MKPSYFLTLFFLMALSLSMMAAPVKISSPNGKIELQVFVDKKVSIKLCSGDHTLMEIDGISLDTDKGLMPSASAKIRKVQRASVASLTGARDIIRGLRNHQEINDTVYVEVMPGDYYMDKQLLLSPLDAGSLVFQSTGRHPARPCTARLQEHHPATAFRKGIESFNRYPPLAIR